jgi:hypothetical protein
MIHLWMDGTEVESFALSNPSREYDAAYTDAQKWANSRQQPTTVTQSTAPRAHLGTIGASF